MVNLKISSSSANTCYNLAGNVTIQSTNSLNNIAIISNTIMTVYTPELTINNLQLYAPLMLQLTPSVSNIYINSMSVFKSADASEQGRIIFTCDDTVSITINNINIQTDTLNYASGTLVTSAPIYFNYNLTNTPTVLLNMGYMQVKNTSVDSGFRILSSNNTNDTSFAIMKDFVAYPISMGNVVSGKNTILINTTNINHD